MQCCQNWLPKLPIPAPHLTHSSTLAPPPAMPKTPYPQQSSAATSPNSMQTLRALLKPLGLDASHNSPTDPSDNNHMHVKWLFTLPNCPCSPFPMQTQTSQHAAQTATFTQIYDHTHPNGQEQLPPSLTPTPAKHIFVPPQKCESFIPITMVFLV